MNAPRICKHCNGTTFCGGHKTADGKVKTWPACTSCLIKSSLDPNSIYQKVVCSVCSGTGLVQPETAVRREKLSTGVLLLLVSPLLACVALLIVWVVMDYNRRLAVEGNLRTFERQSMVPAHKMPFSEVQEKVKKGDSEEDVSTVLGEPYLIKNMPGDATTFLWYYHILNGERIHVLMVNKKVQSIGED